MGFAIPSSCIIRICNPIVTNINLYFIIYIILFISCNFLLNNTDFVKESVLNTDYSMKIGEALDNYKYFDWKISAESGIDNLRKEVELFYKTNWKANE